MKNYQKHDQGVSKKCHARQRNDSTWADKRMLNALISF